MGPYTKIQGSWAIDDGWMVKDGDGVVIAHLDTESMSDALMCSLNQDEPSMSINGRWGEEGRRRFDPVASIRKIDDGSLKVRIDDDHDPEFWMEITVRPGAIRPAGLDHIETATILAALRFYQGQGMGVPANRPNWLQAIACPGEDDTSLDFDGINHLFNRLNCNGDVSGDSNSEAPPAGEDEIPDIEPFFGR